MPPLEVRVRPMLEADVPAAGVIFRRAFGTFLGLPDPDAFSVGRDMIGPRWRARPEQALVAETPEGLAGSNILTRWGSFAFFGPLTVAPPYWDHGVAQVLLEATVARFQQWGVRESALFTFATSPKHMALYQKFGYWPGSLTALMSAPAAAAANRATRYSALSPSAQAEALAACRQLCDRVFSGLDATPEIEAIDQQRLGETLLLWDDAGLEAVAMCHAGADTEAGPDTVYIKFAAARPGAPAALDRLIAAARGLAAERGFGRVEAGVNLARRGAWRRLLECGFKTSMWGVAMHRPDGVAYNQPGALVLDDWR